MSKAFTKETDADDTLELPEREISSLPNLVSQRGLGLIEAEIEHQSAANAAALAAGDREAAVRANRELRYWTARRNSAQLQPDPASSAEVQFGSAVSILREDGRRQSFRIDGEDEADPAQGLLSWASPLARELMGKGTGEEIEAGTTEAKIVAISA